MRLSTSSDLALSTVLSSATIELALRSGERDAAFAELIARIPDLEQKPEAKQALLHALQEREKRCSTGFDSGVAIPHTRDPIAGLEHPVVVFGRRLKGIAYGAIGDAPVKLVFLLVAPTVRHHLHLLGRLSRLLRDSQLRQDLLQAESAEEVLVFLEEAEQRL